MTLTFKSTKSADAIFEYLSSMQKYVMVHPVIGQIDSIGDNKYLVHETLPLGSIPIRFTYPFTLESNLKDKTVTIHATVMKLTKIKISFKITAGSDFTNIEDTIEFKSILPIKSMMQKIFKEQHEKLFKNIEAASL